MKMEGRGKDFREEQAQLHFSLLRSIPMVGFFGALRLHS